MQNPTDPAEASVSTVTVREGPRLNPMGTFTGHRKAAKRSERWYKNIAEPLSTPARKKPRHGEHVPTATDEAARKIASPESSVGLPPPTAATDDADSVTETQPNTGATGRWTEEEVAKLISAVTVTCKKKKKNGKKPRMDWGAIATLVPGRTEKQCRNRWKDTLYHSISLTAGRTGSWTEDEDLKLKYSVQIHGGKNWAAIAALVPSRTQKQCNRRWSHALDPRIALTAGRTCRFTDDEDLKLNNAVQTRGDKNWGEIAALVPGRTKVQCYNRWYYCQR
jgi:hypothetical protein